MTTKTKLKNFSHKIITCPNCKRKTAYYTQNLTTKIISCMRDDCGTHTPYTPEEKKIPNFITASKLVKPYVGVKTTPPEHAPQKALEQRGPSRKEKRRAWLKSFLASKKRVLHDWEQCCNTHIACVTPK